MTLSKSIQDTIWTITHIVIQQILPRIRRRIPRVVATVNVGAEACAAAPQVILRGRVLDKIARALASIDRTRRDAAALVHVKQTQPMSNLVDSGDAAALVLVGTTRQGLRADHGAVEERLVRLGVVSLTRHQGGPAVRAEVLDDVHVNRLVVALVQDALFRVDVLRDGGGALCQLLVDLECAALEIELDLVGLESVVDDLELLVDGCILQTFSSVWTLQQNMTVMRLTLTHPSSRDWSEAAIT